jgi:hypothetical protein
MSINEWASHWRSSVPIRGKYFTRELLDILLTSRILQSVGVLIQVLDRPICRWADAIYASRETIGTPLKWVTANGWRGHCSGAFPTGGSINEVGWRFQPSRISDLELVDQNSGSWNHISSWLHRVEALRDAA